MVAERTGSSSCDVEGCPGSGLCAAVSLVLAVSAVTVAHSLVLSTLATVPELAAAAVVYALFLFWGLGWILLTAGYQRARRVNRGRQPRQEP